MSLVTFHRGLGIQTGDIVTTSWGSGPYMVVHVRGPRYVDRFPGTLIIRAWPVISLTVIRTLEDLANGAGKYYIGGIRREEARWLTDANDEIFVLRPDRMPFRTQMAIHSTPPAPPQYSFQDGVDYALPGRSTWKCEECGRDFNEIIPEHAPAWHCGMPAIRLIVMPPRLSGTRQETAYVLSLD